MFLQLRTNPPHNTITITEENIAKFLHNVLQAIKYKGYFFTPNPEHSNFS